MYYEEAEVKEYFRKDSKGNKKPYYQIGIKKKSKFNKPTTVALVDVAEIKKLESLAKPEVITELEAKLNAIEEEKLQLNTGKCAFGDNAYTCFCRPFLASL